MPDKEVIYNPSRKMSNLKLREVIKQIRACKTAAEERAVISKESALIRNAFKVIYKPISFYLLSINTILQILNLICRKKSVNTAIETSQSFFSSIC